MMHLVDCARGALKLYALQLRHPHTVSPEQAQTAGQEALERLELLDSSTFQLAEAYKAARAIVPAHLTVAVAPHQGDGKSLMVMVLDGNHLLSTVYGKSPEGIAALMNLNKVAA
jgi:hypothetical protein